MELKNCSTLVKTKRTGLFKLASAYKRAILFGKAPANKVLDNKKILVWLDGGSVSNSKLLSATPASDTQSEQLKGINITPDQVVDLLDAIAGDGITELQQQVSQQATEIDYLKVKLQQAQTQEIPTKKSIGRPPKYTPEQRQEIREAHTKGVSIRKLAKAYGMSTRTVQMICKEEK